MQQPRLLIISQEIPQSVHAGGILLQRLLRGYPEGQLLVFGPSPSPDARLLPCPYHNFSPRSDRLLRTRFSQWIAAIQAPGIFSERLPHNLSKLADAFKPEVVLTVFQSYAFYAAALQYSESRKAPLVLVSYDDPNGFSRAPAPFRALETRRDRRVYRAAVKRLAVSPEMAEEFRARYGAESSVVYPIRSESVTPRVLDRCRTLRAPGVLTIGYAGALSYGYGPQLKAMLPVFANSGAVLRVYSGSTPDWERSPAWTYAGFSQNSETTWQKVQEECDAVILPYCWPDQGHEILYRTHFPSKLPEYLALGMPVIVVGPPYATGVRWAVSHPEAALTVTENDSSILAPTLRRLKDDPQLRECLVQGALKAGALDFDPLHIRAKFLQHVSDAATRNRHASSEMAAAK